MNCPDCGSSRVYHSRAKLWHDRVVKRLAPVTFYRCHACGWRRPKMRAGVKGLTLHFLSLIGSIASVLLLLGIVIAVIAGALMFFGVPMPWTPPH